MSRLIAGSGSRALPTYLTMLYSAHLRDDAPGRVFDNDIPNLRTSGRARPWVDLAGMHRPPRSGMTPSTNRRRLRKSLTTALDTLEKHRLVALTGPEGAAGRYDRFTVLADDDTEDQYSVPGGGLPNRVAIRLPSLFFYNGWHLVLTSSEIAVLLAIVDRTGYLSRKPRTGAVGDVGVDLKESERWGTYGLSGEAYNAIHTLAMFGLIDVLDPMPNRARPIPYFTAVRTNEGTVRFDLEGDQHVPLRLVYPPATTDATVDTLFEGNAYDTAMSALDAAIAVERERINLTSGVPD